MQIIKKTLKFIYKKIYILFNLKIPSYYFKLFISGGLINDLKKQGVTQIREFKFKIWHFGYRYYTGVYNSRKVFIKYNSNKKLIEHENTNFLYLSINEYIYKKLPTVYMYKEYKKGAYLIEEFIDTPCLADKYKDKNLNYEKLFSEFINILEAFQSANFVMSDLNLNNIYVDSDNNVRLVDLGFSMKCGDKDLSYIGNNNKVLFVLKHLNEDNRLDVAFIDDAVSFILISNQIYPDFMKDYPQYWNRFNELSNKCFLDFRDIINENKKS